MNDFIGSELKKDKKINDQINALVESVSAYSEKIQKIRDPQSGLKKKSDAKVQEIDNCRGRPLFFDYIGSGIGHGPYVELEDGSVKLDLINGIGINILGHSHSQILKACLRGAIQDVVMQGNLQPNKEYLQLKKKLIDLASRKSRLKHAWLTTSGSMANENALKMCRQKKSSANMILALNSAFAGRTTMMAEVTDNSNFKVGLPSYKEVLRVPSYKKSNKNSPQNSLSVLKEHIAQHEDKICCFMVELMQGEGGYRVVPREFFLPLFEFCKEKKIPIWIDEIQTFCRTGEFFAYETLALGEYVDICTVAKTLQNAATLYTEEYNPQPGLIAGTFSGSTVSMNAGLAILDFLDDGEHMGPQGKINQIYNQFVGMLNDLNQTSCKGLLKEVEGLGLMVGVTPLDGSREKVMKLLKVLFKNGIIAFSCGRDPYRLRFLIPAILTKKDILVARQAIEKSILEVAEDGSLI